MTLTPALTKHLRAAELFAPLHTIAHAAAGWTGATFDVFNPSTGELLATLPEMGIEEAHGAIEAAAEAQVLWAAKPAKDRSAVLRRWHDLIVEHADDLAAILTAEMGKPIAESKGEVLHAAAYVEWYAEEAKRIYGETFPAPANDRRMLVIKQPVGVVGTITPWNFPASMVARKISPALAAGCTIVLKPAEQTPLVAGAMFVLAEKAGFPTGVVNLLYASEGAAIGRELCSNPKVRKISFTGSTEVGRLLMRQCSDQIKKVSLELGGNAPFIVFDDADLDAAVEGALVSKFRNAGQTCVCANRLYVHERVHDAFAQKLAEALRALKVGPGDEEGVRIGPLIDEAAVRKVEEHLADAVAKGAQVLSGGRRHPLGGSFFEPTVLTGVTQAMTVAREETFGPLAPLFRFHDEAEVVRMANDTEFGLASYFYARDLGRVWRVAEQLEYGMVGVNTGLISNEVAPFGGVKQSGLGREGSRHGIEDYLVIKYINMAGIA